MNSPLLSAHLEGVLCPQDPHASASPHRDVFNRAKTAVAGVTAAECHRVAQFDGKRFLAVPAQLLPLAAATGPLFTLTDHYHAWLAVWHVNTSWCTDSSSRNSAGTEGCLVAVHYGIFNLAEIVNSLCSMAGSLHIDDKIIQLSERKCLSGSWR